jgi:hypothetical protein
MEEDKAQIEFVPRKWGFEKILTKSNKYSGVYQYISKEVIYPFNYCKIQDRTIYVHSGKIKIYFSDNLDKLTQLIAQGIHVHSSMDTVILNKGDGFHLPPRRLCQFVVLEDSEIYIFSTKQVQGDYFEIEEK